MLSLLYMLTMVVVLNVAKAKNNEVSVCQSDPEDFKLL